MTTFFERLKVMIERNSDTLLLLDRIEGYLPKRATQSQPPKPDIELLIHNFSRYGTRAMYFANKVIDEAIKQGRREKEVEGIGTGAYYFLAASDAIYFNFDSFIVFSRSIVERSIFNKAKKNLEQSIWEKFEQFRDQKLPFVMDDLSRYRNEVVHLNHNGSAWSSTVQFDSSNNMFFAVFQDNFSRRPENLLDVLETILKELTEIIQTVSKLLMEDQCLKYGYPTRDYTLTITGRQIKLSSFVKIVP